MLLPAVVLLIAYLLGSLSGSLLLGKMRGVDIRTLGSGNAGGSNALRTMGRKFALLTVLVDVGKGALAALLAWRLLPAVLQPGATYACVLAAAIGHVWPVFHGFRGGKGAATVVGGLAIAWPQVLLPALATWLLSMMCSGYVGLSTMLAGASVLVFAIITGADHLRLGFSLAIVLLLVATHRGNLARMRAGCEPRSERMRVLGKIFARRQE
ncbi:MAG: glycerol-3-phosphate 1-O-acyltransferase PlsY, partial [Arenimonas sp.]